LNWSCCGWEKGRTGAYLAAIFGALLILAALVLAMWRFTTPPDLAAERAAQRAKAREELTAAETEMLTTYGWMDKTKGIVHIPVSEALKLSLQQAQDPAAARKDLIAREEKATALGPRLPPKPSQYE
jgi:uncharacterized protein (DUF58 family)